MIILPQMLQLGRTSKFQRISNFQIERFPQNVWIVIRIFEILRVRLNSVTKKSAKTGKFQTTYRVPDNSEKVPENF